MPATVQLRVQVLGGDALGEHGRPLGKVVVIGHVDGVGVEEQCGGAFAQ